MVRDDGGISLPTAGYAALKEAGRLVMADAESLAKLGEHALKSGDIAGAGEAAE